MNPTKKCMKAVISSMKRLLASGNCNIDDIVNSSECQSYSQTEIDDCIYYLKQNHYIRAKIIPADDKIYDMPECAVTDKGNDLLKE